MQRSPITASRRPHRLALATALLSLFSLTTTATAAVPRVLDQAPKGAQMLIVVPNLNTLSKHLARFKQALQLPIPQLDNLLAALKQRSHIRAGLKDTGSLMLVIPDLTTVMQDPTAPDLALLVPVSNYAAFMSNFGGRAAGNLTTLRLPDGRDAYAKSVAGYAVISLNQTLVTNYTPGHQASVLAQRAGSLGRKYLSDADIALYVDLQAIAPTAVPMIDNALANMETRLPGYHGRGATTPEQQHQLQQIAKVYSQAVKAVLRQATAMISTIKLTKDGVAMTDILKAKPNTELAALFPGGSGQTTSTLLNKLPNASYLMATAYDFKAVNMNKLLTLFLSSMPQQSGLKPMLEIIQKQSLPLAASIEGSATIVLAPSQKSMMGGGLIRAITVNQVNDSKQFLARNKKYLTSLNDKKIVLSPATKTKAAQQIGFNSSYTENALKVDGKSVDMYHVQINLPTQTPKSIAPLMMVLGGTGYSGYIVAEGNDVLNTTALDQQLVAQGLETIKKNNGLGADPQFRKIRAQMPPNLALESYLSLSGIAHTADLFLPMFGLKTIDVPKDLPPIATGLGIVDQTLAYRVYLPNRTSAFAVNLVKRYLPMLSGLRGTRRTSPPTPPHPQPHQAPEHPPPPIDLAPAAPQPPLTRPRRTRPPICPSR